MALHFDIWLAISKARRAARNARSRLMNQSRLSRPLHFGSHIARTGSLNAFLFGIVKGKDATPLHCDIIDHRELDGELLQLIARTLPLLIKFASSPKWHWRRKRCSPCARTRLIPGLLVTPGQPGCRLSQVSAFDASGWHACHRPQDRARLLER